MRATATPALCGLSRLLTQPLPPARDRRCRGDTSHPRAATCCSMSGPLRLCDASHTSRSCTSGARRPAELWHFKPSSLTACADNTRSLTDEGSAEVFKAKFSRWSHHNQHAPSLRTLPNIVGQHLITISSGAALDDEYPDIARFSALDECCEYRRMAQEQIVVSPRERPAVFSAKSRADLHQAT
jgi:hypothetical protein